MILRALLMLHIGCGAIAFVCAPVALVTAKGGKTHRRWGKIYFWAMAGVASTALILSIVLPILFLALVAVFSFYAAFSAYRILSLKDLNRGGKANRVDWAAAGITFLSSAALAGIGIFRPQLVPGRGIIAVVFGALGMMIAGRSIRTFLNPPLEKQFWWYLHMSGMIGSYIGAVTAFTVVNLGHWFGNAWWVWLGPAMVGVPGIQIWVRYYKAKFRGRDKAVGEAVAGI
ncbi:MAG: hypothetical protein WBD98_02095 [Acidobacteriaceae bacterium]